MDTEHVRRRVLTLLPVVLLAAPTAALRAQPAPTKNPYTSPEDVHAGSRLFRALCTLCHGRSGGGGLGRDLTLGVFRYGNSDDALFRMITSGNPQTGMPGIGLEETQTWQLVAFVRSPSQKKARLKVPGDPVQGEKLFRVKGDCLRCHIVNARGGRLGPTLSDIGWRRSPGHLRTSVVDANAVLPLRFSSVQAVDRDGRTILGLLLNEDTFSIQIMDLQENIRSYWKRDLDALQRGKVSTMPEYKDLFTAAELDHLVAYLYSLRGNRRSP